MNKQMLKQYKKLVNFLGAALGSDYEVILHDISSKKNAIAAIANGHVSGRTIDAPLTDFALQKIAEKSYETEDYTLNYKGIAGNGKKALRSSTMYIKDEDDNLVGMLCINFDSSKFDALKQNVLDLMAAYLIDDQSNESNQESNSETGAIEKFSQSISDVISSSLSSEVSKCDVPIDRLTMDEKMRIVEALNKKGVFLLKGAVTEVANELCCSDASIYRYLSKISKNQGK
jgi:predicted transcriptional regulator YheO